MTRRKRILLLFTIYHLVIYYLLLYFLLTLYHKYKPVKNIHYYTYYIFFTIGPLRTTFRGLISSYKENTTKSNGYLRQIFINDGSAEISMIQYGNQPIAFPFQLGNTISVENGTVKPNTGTFSISPNILYLQIANTTVINGLDVEIKPLPFIHLQVENSLCGKLIHKEVFTTPSNHYKLDLFIVDTSLKTNILTIWNNHAKTIDKQFNINDYIVVRSLKKTNISNKYTFAATTTCFLCLPEEINSIHFILKDVNISTRTIDVIDLSTLQETTQKLLPFQKLHFNLKHITINMLGPKSDTTVQCAVTTSHSTHILTNIKVSLFTTILEKDENSIQKLITEEFDNLKQLLENISCNIRGVVMKKLPVPPFTIGLVLYMIEEIYTDK